MAQFYIYIYRTGADGKFIFTFKIITAFAREKKQHHVHIFFTIENLETNQAKGQTLNMFFTR